MFVRLGLLGLVLCASLGRVANAEPFTQFEVAEPEGQNDRAVTTKMPWCPAKYTADSWDTGRIYRQIGMHSLRNMGDAAEHLCEHKEDPTWVKQATYLVQAWMNYQNMTQADAEADIARVIQKLHEEREEEGKPPSEEKQNAFSSYQLKEVKPDDGIAQAKITGKPAWCDKADVSDKWDAGRIYRTMDTGYADALVEAADHICQRTDPTWLKKAGYILQTWMNWTGMSQAEAEKSLRARIQESQWKSQRDALCKELEPGPEDSGQVRTFALARKRFFACGDDKPMWLSRGSGVDNVDFYLDIQGPKPESEVLRMFYLFSTVPLPERSNPLPTKDAFSNRPLMYYAIAQRDYADLDAAALDKELSGAPYNEYARTIAMESLASLKAERKMFEAAVDKLTKNDEDYKAILRDAPAKGFADWEKLSGQWKAELERSNAFEKKLSNPSRKALKGCTAELYPDVAKLVKSYKTNDFSELKTKIGDDPIAGILISRLAVCEAAEGVAGSGTLKGLVEHGRNMRGPRTAAYYAVIDALKEVEKDRPRLVLGMSNYYYTGSSLVRMYDRDFDYTGGFPTDMTSGDRGTVKSVKKVEDGLAVVFKTEKLTWPNYDCVDITNHPTSIDSNGNIHYAQNCKPTGTYSSQDMTASPVVIPELEGAAIKPGVFLVVSSAGGTAKNGNSFAIPYYVTKNAKDTKLLAFMGFGL